MLRRVSKLLQIAEAFLAFAWYGLLASAVIGSVTLFYFVCRVCVWLVVRTWDWF